MDIEERKKVVARIASTRLRKAVARTLLRGDQLPDEIISGLVVRHVWKTWGYRRLLECLMIELRIEKNKALDITAEAIKGGHEDGKLYGIDTEK